MAGQRVVGNDSAIAQISNAQVLLQQGIEFYHHERFADAINVFKQAFANSQTDRLKGALVLRYLSLAYQHLGQWQEAEKAILQSRQLLENQKNLTNTPAYLDVLAKTLNAQGRLQWMKGDWSKALDSWKQAEVNYKKNSNNTAVIGILINQITALQWLGLNRQALASFSQQSLVEFPTVEQVIRQIEQMIQQQSDPNLKALAWQSLGEALRRIGNLSQSEEVLQKSLQVAQKYQLAKATSSALLELGNTKRALANTALAINKLEDAKKYTHDAINYYQQAAVSPHLGIQAQLNLLSFWVETGEWLEATKLWPQIQQPLASLAASSTNIYARLNFARSLTCLVPNIDKNSLLRLGCDRSNKLRKNTSEQSLVTSFPSFQQIDQIIATTLQQARSLQDPRAESYALGQLGELYELSGNLAKAQTLTQQAVLLAEQIQAPDIGYRWQWQLGRLWENQGERKKAIAAYTDAVTSLKSIKNDLLSINADVQFSFRDHVEPIYRKLVDLLLATEGSIQPTPENLQQATETIDSLRLAELENFLRCNLSRTVQLNQDINKVDSKAAFVYPIILENRIEIIFKLPGQSLKHYVTSVEKTEVEKAVLELRANVLKRNYPEAVIEKATQLYQWLILPLEQDLANHKEIKTLVFVLDGALRNIPMSVLYDGKRQEYLIEKQYAIALVPDLQLFDLRPLKREQLQVLTAGVSDKKEIDGRLFEPLPNVPEELQQIGSVVPAKPLLNPNFTKVNLQQQINSGTFSTVHIATHGQFSSDPKETYILTYDKLLKSDDLNNLLRGSNEYSRRSIELLVLSACETAQGDNRATLGLAGIAVRAGARSTLATLWQVSDRSTAEVMGQFYQELTNPEMTKAEALHQAQLALFKRYKAPYYWAPYVLVGNWL
ncbi:MULTISPECIES: CHAT domain-containing protein [Fischerella]|uniref:CHAT domain-containing protein n=1 Tax=Fischerella TaxID=1190 RepID=UPI001F54B0C6|nr:MULTISPECIES: CHAT domain-containing protein [Fischerella]